MKNTISQCDEVIARLMQQPEDEAAAKNNPLALESNNKTKDKGKGSCKSFQNQLPVAQSSNIGSSRKPTGQTPNPHLPQSRASLSVRRDPIQMLMRD
ncbi:hypothetical protein O181_011801 [Austropuccinia psidii MF-1]|uniref:Uncharacterized protein n=1 Tax=Austropuccinia psidii MF-1 TaxID=1389203 RepID=A0A9Q3BWF8_9BASI|nr:hypothetical protein [Austropuccinia psidii MF-1]